jgi:hypothetical protein
MNNPHGAEQQRSSSLDVTRRYFLGRGAGVGLGAMALNVLGSESQNGQAGAATGKLAGRHFAPKAKRIIFLTQSGGPSQIELYDEKPGLINMAGKELPASVRNDGGEGSACHAGPFDVPKTW